MVPGRHQGARDGEESAADAGAEAEEHNLLRADRIRHPPDGSAGDEGRKVLDADGKPREDRAEAEGAMHEGWQGGKRQADDKIGGQRIDDGGEDLAHATPGRGRAGGARGGTGFGSHHWVEGRREESGMASL